jgi:EAL domain-containing protein (putative c-di-GMP-specific phosphodiesterase class I)
VKRTLAASGADPARLLLEVDESALSENPAAALTIFERLLGCNVRLAVDNFGSGLAPLNHLVRLPIDVLKLDPRLTQTATQAGRQVAVLESLIHLGLKLGVQVVAQGIETQMQLEALIRMGCELGQGPLLSPALPPSQAQKLAEQGC